MTTQTITEKDHYLAALEREFEITMRLLGDYPPAQLDLKPNDKLKTARDIMWMQVAERAVLQIVIAQDRLEPQPPPPAPATLEALLAALTGAQQELVTKLRTMDASAMNSMITMPVGPKQMGQVRRGDAMWMFMYDGIHHRGQLSVYQRLAGGKVRSIYGPSADEPWW